MKIHWLLQRFLEQELQSHFKRWTQHVMVTVTAVVSFTLVAVQ
ncbi:hypothetical protein B4110_3732 [Parageobacillus toebii]|uniref:Uncharacterized protein n=1 Tax=Parageobacillus toebii TaxID=153151 RepID=A0A150MUY3_9BACL|nr:hypothetical protein B4110_3732 [Parageobacillus toebii]